MKTRFRFLGALLCVALGHDSRAAAQEVEMDARWSYDTVSLSSGAVSIGADHDYYGPALQPLLGEQKPMSCDGAFELLREDKNVCAQVVSRCSTEEMSDPARCSVYNGVCRRVAPEVLCAGPCLSLGAGLRPSIDGTDRLELDTPRNLVGASFTCTCVDEGVVPPWSLCLEASYTRGRFSCSTRAMKTPAPDRLTGSLCTGYGDGGSGLKLVSGIWRCMLPLYSDAILGDIEALTGQQQLGPSGPLDIPPPGPLSGIRF